jgi:hypothetical protein
LGDVWEDKIGCFGVRDDKIGYFGGGMTRLATSQP